MSYEGRSFTLSTERLQQKFNQAKKDNKPFLIQYGTSGRDISILDIETTASTNSGNLEVELERLYNEENTNSQNMYLINIFNTAKDFDSADNITLTKQGWDILDNLRAKTRKEKQDAYEAALSARPFWKKLFNLEP